MDRQTIGQFIDASVRDHSEAERLLAAHPEIRNATWLSDENILSFLAIENFPVGVRFCLENGFDPNQPGDEFGTTPLHFACKLNYVDVAKVLLQHGADPNAISEIDDNPIHCCVQNGAAEILDILITHGANPHYVTPLGETIFDNWPNNAQKQSALSEVLQKHDLIDEP